MGGSKEPSVLGPCDGSRLSIADATEEALLRPLRGARERHLCRVDVPFGHRRLRVAGTGLHVDGRVAGGGVVGQRASKVLETCGK
jgi:hypothetical protein